MIDPKLSELSDADLAKLATQIAEEIGDRDAADAEKPSEEAVRASVERSADYDVL